MNNPFSHDDAFIAQLKRIEQQINQNQLQEAAEQLNGLVKTSPHDPRLFLLGSRLAGAARNPDGMLQAARRAHDLAPQWPVATMHLSEVLAIHGQAEEAMSMAGLAVQQASAQKSIDYELLTKAALVAKNLSYLTQALEWFRMAEKLNPEDSNIRHQIALTLTGRGDYAEAVNSLTNLLVQQPDNPVLLGDRLRASLGAEQFALATQDAQALVAQEPKNETYKFYLSIALGKTPETQPGEFVSFMFDGAAAQFDQQVVGQLRYTLPREIAQRIHEWHPDRKGDILDLGCGTGLLGASLGPIAGVLVGVDLSQNMITQATRHNVYDRFHLVNLLDALRATPENLYSVITALDVMIYVGNLDAVVPGAYRILLPGGRFVFSCESGAEGDADYKLQGTYRYTHQRDYVQRLLKEAGFADVVIEDRVIRHELGEPVHGYLVTAQKPAQAAGKTARKSPKNATPVRLEQ